MKYIFILMFIFFLLLVGLAFLSIRVQFRYLREGSNDEFDLIISIFKGYLKYKLEIPHIELGQKLLRPFLKVKVETEGEKGTPITKDRERILLPKLDVLPELVKKTYRHFLKYKPVIKYFEQHTRFHKLKWHTEFGLQDPAVTGLLVGVIWIIKGNLYAVFQKNAQTILEPPEIAVIPNFQQTKLRLDINCIFDIKVGHIITAMIIFVRKYFTMKEV